MNKNIGHGHVFPRPDGARARCGGPGLCKVCAQDLAKAEKVKPKEYICGVELKILTQDKNERHRLKKAMREMLKEYVRKRPGVSEVSLLSKTEEVWRIEYND